MFVDYEKAEELGLESLEDVFYYFSEYSKTVEVEGGYHLFKFVDEYEMWINQE